MPDIHLAAGGVGLGDLGDWFAAGAAAVAIGGGPVGADDVAENRWSGAREGTASVVAAVGRIAGGPIVMAATIGMRCTDRFAKPALAIAGPDTAADLRNVPAEIGVLSHTDAFRNAPEQRGLRVGTDGTRTHLPDGTSLFTI